MLQETLEAIESVVDETTGGLSDNVKLGLKVVGAAVALGVAYKGYKTMTRSKATGRFTTSKKEQEVPVQAVKTEEVKDDIDAKLDEMLKEPEVKYGEYNEKEAQERADSPAATMSAKEILKEGLKAAHNTKAEEEFEEVEVMVVSLNSLSSSIRDRITELALSEAEATEVEEVILAEETVDVDKVIGDVVFVIKELKKNLSPEMKEQLEALKEVSMLSLVQAEKLGQITRSKIQTKFGNKGVHPGSNGWKIINQELTKLMKGNS